MGWPYVGETLSLYTQNPNTFFSNRQIKCEKRFKSHILGCPCVMISNPEIAKIILVTQSHLFKPTYPISKEMMIGPPAVFFHQGSYHSHLKKLIQSSFLPSALKGLVHKIKDIVLDLLTSWEHTNMINTLHEMKKYSYEVATISVFGKETEIADNIIGVIFAAHDTTSSVLTWLLKYLYDHPHLLDAVKIEQEEIRCERLVTKRGITWDDARRMPVTARVIQETLRAASILSFLFREAVEDVEIEGFINHRWEVIGEDNGIEFVPFPVPKQGLPLKFHRIRAKSDAFNG
ncbi:hypothetical protein L1987_64006 [Smallanthus sonchifolius]|uniref:Uncharacterized protein n=1 Tax=Smallanthus sonchifolius TaxID=185202 RepID=A0ACB9CF57_9ASTR|nr:hypothetical protein L1987_64006 [Smallanthus sonchifolius]